MYLFYEKKVHNFQQIIQEAPGFKNGKGEVPWWLSGLKMGTGRVG